jgi:hypothetical protein
MKILEIFLSALKWIASFLMFKKGRDYQKSQTDEELIKDVKDAKVISDASSDDNYARRVQDEFERK